MMNIKGSITPPSRTGIYRHAGFSLIELMIVIAIIGILAAVALPAYNNYITHSRRAAAEACLSQYATYMQRYFATNLSYAKDTAGNAMDDAALPTLDCSTAQNTGPYYSYKFSKDEPTASTFSLEAIPQGTQAVNDAQCGTLILTQTGARTTSGSAGTAACWGH